MKHGQASPAWPLFSLCTEAPYKARYLPKELMTKTSCIRKVLHK